MKELQIKNDFCSFLENISKNEAARFIIKNGTINLLNIVEDYDKLDVFWELGDIYKSNQNAKSIIDIDKSWSRLKYLNWTNLIKLIIFDIYSEGAILEKDIILMNHFSMKKTYSDLIKSSDVNIVKLFIPHASESKKHGMILSRVFYIKNH